MIIGLKIAALIALIEETAPDFL